MANTVQFGLESVYFAVYDTQAHTYATPVAMPGAESLGVSTSSGSGESNIYADNRRYFTMAGGSDSKSLTLQMAKFSKEFRTAVLGQTAVTGGGFLESPEDIARPFALLFQMRGDQGGTRGCYYYCTAGVPTYTAATNTDSITENPESSDITATSVKINNKEHAYYACEYGDPNYENFFSAVPLTDGGSE